MQAPAGMTGQDCQHDGKWGLWVSRCPRSVLARTPGGTFFTTRDYGAAPLRGYA
jgi:hypothetical protein